MPNMSVWKKDQIKERTKSAQSSKNIQWQFWKDYLGVKPASSRLHRMLFFQFSVLFFWSFFFFFFPKETTYRKQFRLLLKDLTGLILFLCIWNSVHRCYLFYFYCQKSIGKKIIAIPSTFLRILLFFWIFFFLLAKLYLLLFFFMLIWLIVMLITI